MKLINFKNETKNNPLAPEWNYFMCETFIENINLKNLSKYLLKKEKDILKLQSSKDINNNLTDGYTGLGLKSVTSKFKNYNLFTFKNKEIDKLKKEIIKKHNLFIQALGLELPKTLYGQCWYNILRKNEEIKIHSHGFHPDIYLGGHFCVQTKDTSTFFVSSINQINEPNVYESKNENKKLNLFQNFIPHYTNKNNYNIPRITIAFDLSLVKNSQNFSVLYEHSS